MKFNAGIITEKIEESKKFYSEVLGLTVVFENDFYLLLTNEKGDQLSFLLPDHPSQEPVFQSKFTGRGVYITVELDDVEKEYQRVKSLGVPIELELREEAWGDKHFAVVDPNGIGVDIVTYSPPES